MPSYDYRCNECQFVQEITHSIKVDPDFFCPQCKKLGKEIKMERLISINKSGFIFKQWTESHVHKIGNQKRKQNLDLEKRQIERYGSGGPRLRPNVAGMEVDSWRDAKKLAKEAGMNTESYNKAIDSEKNISKTSGVDDRRWKAAKDASS